MIKVYCKVEGVPFQLDRPELDSRDFTIGSWAKFCPVCLIGWAHFTVVKDNKLDGSHRVGGQLCRTCGLQVMHQPRYIPGSLLEEPSTNFQTLDWDLLKYLPKQMLIREFNIHDAFFTRQAASYGNTTKSTFDTTFSIAQANVEWRANSSNVGGERLPGLDLAGDGLTTERR